MQDQLHSIDGAISLKFGAFDGTGDAAAVAVDLAGYESATILVATGAYTDGAHTIGLEDCDTVDGTYADVDAKFILGSKPVIDAAGDANSIFMFGYTGGKRFVKVKNTVTEGTTGCILGAAVIRGNPRRKPLNSA